MTTVPVSSTEAVGRQRGRGHTFFRFAFPTLLTLLLLDSAYLFLANRASGPPRIALSAFAYEGTLLLHLIVGLLSVGWFVLRLGAILRMLRERQGPLAVMGALTSLSLVVCLVTGVAFLGIGFQILPLGLRYGLRLVHDIGTAGLLIFGFLYLRLRARQAADQKASSSVPSGGESSLAPEQLQARLAKRLAVALGLPFLALLAYTLKAPNTDRIIENPALPPMTAFDEGDGKDGKFFPASVQSVGGQFFPSEYFVDSKSCGAKGCHEDIYTQWNSSAHHLASFNNQWYRKAIEYMQEVVGTKPSKWCAGCHDMAVLLTEDPHSAGHSRFDVPIAAHDFPDKQYPESHAGIGCAVCHSIVHVKSTTGNSDYTADYPPMHKYLLTDNKLMKSVHNFLTRLAPEPHKKTFLRPFHVESTARFCSSCHKVHLDVPVNNYRWFRGFNDYDSWQGSGVSGLGAISFYYPSDEKTGQPAFKKCADCHMPQIPSRDPGNIDGFVHSHRFPAANTALPTAYHDAKQLEATQKFLQDKALSIDIFALRRAKDGAGHSVSANGKNARASIAKPQTPDTPQAASLNGDTMGTNLPVAAGNVSAQEETLVAPLNRGGIGAALKRGESPLVDVVVRTRKLGHAFPGGTTDAAEVWVELEAKDDQGKPLYHSGKLQWDKGPVEEGAERYRSLLVDGHSHPINKRNAWAARAVVYAKVIPPGAADVVHFRLRIPRDCGKTVTLTAKLNYRKFTWWNNAFAFAGRTVDYKRDAKLTRAADNGGAKLIDAAGRTVETALGVGKTSGPVAHGWDDRQMHFDNDTSIVSGLDKRIPDLPITVLAQDSITLPVVDANASPVAPPTPADAKKDRERWNDYGIGLLLQGDFLHATNAFEQVTKVAPKWAEGYVNIGRVRQAERDSQAAQAAFMKAFALYDASTTPMTPYQRARTQYFYAQTLFDRGQLDEALKILDKVIEVFPDDRNVRNLAGTIYFRLGRYDDAILHFRHTLSIDPEDIAAHYNLMKCFRGKGDAVSADIHARLYKRFKADETNTNLVGNYMRTHPEDNNLAQPIHEHGDAIVRPMPDWVRQTMQKQTIAHKSKANVKPVVIRKTRPGVIPQKVALR